MPKKKRPAAPPPPVADRGTDPTRPSAQPLTPRQRELADLLAALLMADLQAFPSPSDKSTEEPEAAPGEPKRQKKATPLPEGTRLLNLRQAAAYLNLSFWSVRDYVLSGRLPYVQLPPLSPREGDRPRQKLRRVLVDIRDLDAFIEAHKVKPQP
jgi:hypothetical protein